MIKEKSILNTYTAGELLDSKVLVDYAHENGNYYVENGVIYTEREETW